VSSSIHLFFKSTFTSTISSISLTLPSSPASPFTSSQALPLHNQFDLLSVSSHPPSGSLHISTPASVSPVEEGHFPLSGAMLAASSLRADLSLPVAGVLAPLLAPLTPSLFSASANGLFYSHGHRIGHRRRIEPQVVFVRPGTVGKVEVRGEDGSSIGTLPSALFVTSKITSLVTETPWTTLAIFAALAASALFLVAVALVCAARRARNKESDEVYESILMEGVKSEEEMEGLHKKEK